MIKKLGTPDEESLHQIKNPQAVSYIKKQAYIAPKKISEKLKGYSNPLALDLIDKCLTFNPKKRISAEEAMRHPYYKELFEEEHLKKGVVIDFSFEKKNLTLQELQMEIMEEISDLN